jgi:hypothetical protein
MLVRRTESRPAAPLSRRAVEGLPHATPTNEKAPRERVLVAGEEDAFHAAPSLLQTRRGLGTGDDHYVARGHADDQVARHDALQPSPEIVGQQQAGLETLKRQHQRWWLTVELGPG